MVRTPNAQYRVWLPNVHSKLVCAAEEGGGHTEGKRGVPALTMKNRAWFSCDAHHTDKETGALSG